MPPLSAWEFGSRASTPCFNALYLQMVRKTSFSFMRPWQFTLLSVWVRNTIVIGLPSIRTTQTQSICSPPYTQNQPITPSSCPLLISSSTNPLLRRSTMSLESKTSSQITFRGFKMRKPCNWLQNCEFAVFNPLRMRWGRLKNDQHYTWVQAACSAALANGPLDPRAVHPSRDGDRQLYRQHINVRNKLLPHILQTARHPY